MHTTRGRRSPGSRRVFRPSWLLLVAVAGGCVPRTALMDYRGSEGFALDPPQPDKALVVFARPGRMAGYVASVVYDGQDLVAVLMDVTYAAYPTTPVKHRFMVVSEAADFMDGDLEAGRVYFAEVRVRMGIWRGRFSLQPVTPHDEEWREVREWLSGSHLVTLNAAGRSWAQENAGSVRNKHDSYLPKWLAKSERPAPYAQDGGRRPQELPGKGGRKGRRNDSGRRR